MKILSLKMMAWGPFTDWSVDLSKGAEGLHLIYGPNEAGKSAALRGLKSFLFGIDPRTTDNFLHDYKKLLIGGRLKRSDGRTVEMVRKKGNIKTLFAPDGTVIEERVLQEFLGGVAQDTFSRMFGLDHVELRFGGKEIVSGKGDVGQSLFMAAAGGQSIQQILDRMEEEAGDLFSPKTTAKKAVNTRYEQYQLAIKEAREASLPSQDWVEHTRRRGESEERKTALSEEIRRAKSDLGRRERIRDALPSLGRRKELQKQRADVGDVLILPEGFPETRRATLKALAGAREIQAKAQKKLVELDEQLRILIVPAALLDEGDAVTDLHKLMGGHVKAIQDLRKLTGEAERLEVDAAALLDDIRPGAAGEEAEALKLGLAKRKSVRDLGGRHEALLQALRSARTSVKTLQAKIEKARVSLAKMAAPLDPRPLKDLLKRVRRLGDLEADIEKKRSQLGAEVKQAGIEMQRLPLWKGTLDELEALSVPEEETVSRFEKELTGVELQSREFESQLKGMLARESELAGNLEKLDLTSAVPTEQDLAEARLRREKGWKLVRAAWLEGGNQKAEVEAFCGEEPLDAAYENSVRQADETADRLRREADRVAQHAGLVADRERVVQEIRRLKEEGAALGKAQADLQSNWQELWRPCGFNPLSPREMPSWMQKQRALVQRAEKIRAGRLEVESAETQIVRLNGEISAELKRLGENEPEPALNLNALIDHGQKVVDRIEQTNAGREKLETSIAEAETELAETGRNAVEAEENFQTWQSQWMEAVKEIGLSGSASPEVANQLLDRVQELAKKTEELAKVRKRIGGIRRDSEAFDRQARELANRVASDLLNLPAEGIASQLNARLARGREDEAARKQLLQQHQGQERDLAEAEDAIRKAEQKLEEMCVLAKCSSIDELEPVERLSAEATAIDTELKSIEKELLAFAGGGTVEDLVRDAQAIDPDALPGQISELQEQLSAMEGELSQVYQTIGSEKTELARMDGNSRAADAAEIAQSSLAQIRDGMERYVRLRLACIVLRKEIEQYRAKNQGPVLKRASDIFATLTLGSFAGLRTNFDDGDRPVLVGMRPSGEQVGVDGMSDGTCDQLYLSLRLASLEKHLETQEPMPFIVDDILVNFDDRRSEATLKILAELSQKTQVIFFTHHQHLISLAEKCVPQKVLSIYPMCV